ncbi:hypothetical protein PBY51_015623 [Eleginops maclovinus]|uniref:Uncharacterized protein n=1 Tax=Eleginops maclovinus TaxID=56733 RepID=A0AAN7XNY0_ELEMC|nr:hypothetical protein PBY51_015623 [Eleginops maclovinus]
METRSWTQTQRVGHALGPVSESGHGLTKRPGTVDSETVTETRTWRLGLRVGHVETQTQRPGHGLRPEIRKQRPGHRDPDSKTQTRRPGQCLQQRDKCTDS